MNFASLRFRLLVAAAGFVLAALILSGVWLTILFQRHVEGWVDAELTAWLDQLISGIDAGPNGTLIVARPPADPRFERPMSGLYWEVLAPGGQLLRSRSLWDFSIALPQDGSPGASIERHRAKGPDGGTLYLVQRSVELPEPLDRKTVLAAVAIDASEVDAATRRFAGALAPFLLVLGSLLIAAAYLQVRVGLRPLAAMREKLAGIASGARKRLGSGFPEEVQPLAAEIDTLLDDRDKQIERARARASDLAHGLKTPLQVLLSDVEALKRKGETETAEEIEGIVMAMQGHVERQLSRARLAPFNAKASADAGAVAEQVVRVMSRTPAGERLAWTVTAPMAMFARIDSQDLSEALGNLIGNAVRYARSRISVLVQAEGDGIEVAITDDGPGIPAEQWEKMLERGSRLDQHASGAGLGLAIVKDIAESWGANLSFESKNGFRVLLRLTKPSPPT